MVSVGTIIWLSSELMFFAALFASYFTIRAVSPDLWAMNTEKLNVTFAAVNTTILVLSSLTCQLGVFAAERGQVGRSGSHLQVGKWGLREWFILTYIMGAVFIGGQVYEFTTFYREGLGYTTNIFGSAFYTLTGFHGVHVTVGIIMLMSLFVMSHRGNLGPERAETVETIGLYWHFVDIVWIVIFTIVYLIP